MTGRIYEGIVEWLRNKYPDLDEAEIQDRAQKIYQAWLDGVV
jgi:hypothetical protein